MRHLNEHQHNDEPAQWSRAVIGYSLVLIFFWISIAMSWIWEDEGKPTTTPSYHHYRLHTHQELNLHPPKEPPKQLNINTPRKLQTPRLSF